MSLASLLVLALMNSSVFISASKMPKIPMKKVEVESKYIVMASVLSVTEESEDKRYGRQKCKVKISAVLKGSVKEKEIIVFMGWKGLKGFDPKLKEGQSIILFLKNIEKGVGQLAFRGAVAVFPKGHIK